jgi:hypothetical protein
MRFIDPTGESTYGLALCGRCSRKLKLAELQPDANSPGLMVCAEDRDDYDPYRLAPRADDQVVLPFVRPDTSITIQAVSTAPLTVSEDGQRFLFDIG